MIIQSLLFLITSLTVFLILTEVLTIDISYGEVTVIDFNFTIFAIRFINRKSEKKKKRKKRSRTSFKSVADFIISTSNKSEIILHRLNVSLPDSEPANNAIKQGFYLTFISSLLAYIDCNAKKFYIGNITFDNSANNNYKISFDLSFRISLRSFLVSLPKLIKNRKRKV